MTIKFSKMHGLGNDFVVIDAVRQAVVLSHERIRQLADRRFGIGCDQLLLVESATRQGVDFRYRIFNADGSEVQQCGNGARCFARFVREQGLSDKDSIVVETASGIITLYHEANDRVRVDMGVPSFVPASLPFLAGEEQSRYQLAVGNEILEVGAVSMGNPHLVLQVADLEQAPVAELGPLLESHAMFPERVNVGFMQLVDAGHIRLRVYERGAAETLACGTGACAAVAVAHRWGMVNDEVTVTLPGGDLQIRWPGEGQALWMLGPAVTVFEGTIEL
jgi:diaminopimelate epimerase